MTSNEVNAINIGTALREGLHLKTVEIVALLHNACKQLDAGVAATLPRSADDLWVTGAGTVVLPRIEAVASPRDAVAELLEALLRVAHDEVDPMPAALRSLPDRLRASGPAPRDSDLKDLLTILRWHLPDDSSAVLRDLVTRSLLSTAAEPDGIDVFEDEGEQKLPAAPVITPAPAETPASQTSAVNVASPAPVHQHHRRVLAAVAALALMFAAGFAGYRFTAQVAPALTTASSTPIDEQPIEPLPGRVATAEVQPRPAPVARVEGIRSLQPHPLDLPVTGGAFSPSFASGGALLFHAGRNTAGRLFQASLDAGGNASAITPLLEDRGRTYHARPSPDGAWVAFDSDRDGERGVYVAARNGQHIARVSGEGFAAVPSWSPDMKWLAFIRAEASRPKVWNLWLRNISTGMLERHSTFRSGQVWGASWFPDSRSLCYSHEDRLIISDPIAGSSQVFRSPLRGRLIRTPAVSPDGKQIVFQVYRDGAWLLDVPTGNMRRVLADPSAEEFAWDPDGKHIAYHSRRDGQWRIWMMSI